MRTRSKSVRAAAVVVAAASVVLWGECLAKSKQTKDFGDGPNPFPRTVPEPRDATARPINPAAAEPAPAHDIDLAEASYIYVKAFTWVVHRADGAVEFRQCPDRAAEFAKTAPSYVRDIVARMGAAEPALAQEMAPIMGEFLEQAQTASGDWTAFATARLARSMSLDTKAALAAAIRSAGHRAVFCEDAPSAGEILTDAASVVRPECSTGYCNCGPCPPGAASCDCQRYNAALEDCEVTRASCDVTVYIVKMGRKAVDY